MGLSNNLTHEVSYHTRIYRQPPCMAIPPLYLLYLANEIWDKHKNKRMRKT